ncbi:MAG: UpxY family transcription antiterminator [Acidobacteria bacterium]|nr:UpxY family transcription antiterminator [Acidobacteriaceae bacterium]MBV9607981.1 UpxY family transcription antiterminator [Acidobacteriota bacterium]
MSISTHFSALNAPEVHPSQVPDHLHWYAIHSRSRHEKCIQQYLEKTSIDCFLPLYETVHRWKDRRALVTLPLFPGYLFVRIPIEERLKVLTAPGVVRLLSVHGRPIPVPDTEIDVLRSCASRNLKMAPHPYLTVGRRVLVKSGPFADMEGILVRRKGQFRLVVSVNLIARSVALELDRSDIVALSPTHLPAAHTSLPKSLPQPAAPAPDPHHRIALSRASAA